jgi:hypothetical protein
MENPKDVAAVGIELLDVLARLRRLEQRLGDRDVPLPDDVELRADLDVLPR